MTPVHVIGGFLGAGKTTTVIGLLRALPSERIAVIVNDFGTARIDDAVIAGTGLATVAEIAGGCVCCTAPEGLGSSLKTLLDTIKPDRVLIEPTGLGRPQDIVDTLRRGPLRERTVVGPVVVVVDAATVVQRGDEPLVRDQLEAADVVVLNHADRASEATLEAARTWVATFWPGPERLVVATRGEVPPHVLLAPTAPRERVVRQGRSTDGYTSASGGWPDAVFSRARLAAVIDALPASIVRVKGLFRTEEGTFLLERAGGATHERLSPRRAASCVDVIGSDGVDEALATIGACALSDAERALARDAVELRFDGTVRRLDRAALAALPGVEDVGTVVPKRRGRAAAMSAVWDAAGVPDDAEVVFVAHDGLATPPVAAGTVRGGYLAHTLDDGPLPDADGGPVRLLIPGPGSSPCANVKGVAQIVVRRVI